jgi:hypothetical protein
MTFRTPIKFLRAMGELARKKLVPTWLGSADLRGLDAAVRRQAIFSARMTQIRALQAVADGVKAMLAGEGNLADAKLLLGDTLKALGYEAEKGFPGDKPDQVPPATRGTLTDLASERRKTLIIDTQYKMAANAAFVKAGTEDEQRRYQWPCYELVRIGRRRTPRGMARRKGGLVPKPGDDWPSRFVAAGGELYDKGTRMIAAKGSDVWIKLGEGEGGYMDTLGNPYAPFAFSSGYGLREVARNECLLLGVISPDDTIAKVPVKLAETLKAQAKGLDPALLKAFKRDLVTREDGSVRLKRMMDAELKKADAAYGNRDLRTGAPQAPVRESTLLSNRVAMLHEVMNMGTRAGALLGWITRRQKSQARTGVDAMKKAVNGRKDVEKAMRVPGLGFIDFRWGARGAKRADGFGATHGGGWGISHIHSKRGAKATAKLPIVLARGKIHKHDQPDRRIIQYAGWSAIVRRTGKGRWSVVTFIDDVIRARPGPRGGLKNREARLPLRSTGPTTQMRTGLEFPGSTRARQLFAEAHAGAAKGSRLTPVQRRCKLLLGVLQGQSKRITRRVMSTVPA